MAERRLWSNRAWPRLTAGTRLVFMFALTTAPYAAHAQMQGMMSGGGMMGPMMWGMAIFWLLLVVLLLLGIAALIKYLFKRSPR